MDKEGSVIYDVVVIGAGPAGTVFAREVLQKLSGLKLLIVNGQTAGSAKPCGGLLAPDAQKLLARFDLVLPKSVLEDPQIFAVQTIDVDQRLIRYYQRHYLNMDRYAFDQWLLSLVPSSADVCEGRCEKIERDGELFKVSLRQNGTGIVVRTRTVVGADGAGSIVRRTFFRQMRTQYVAIQQWFENKGQCMPYYSCIFDARTSDSCSWTIHKGGHVIFGGAFEKIGCRAAFEEQKSRLEAYLGSKFGEPVRTEACLLSSPRSGKDFCNGGDGVFLIGEAAGFISASSFEGLSYAMHSGKLLADSFADGEVSNNILKVYKKKTKLLRMRLRIKSLKRALLCNPFIRGVILRSGLCSIKPFACDKDDSEKPPRAR